MPRLDCPSASAETLSSVEALRPYTVLSALLLQGIHFRVGSVEFEDFKFMYLTAFLFGPCLSEGDPAVITESLGDRPRSGAAGIEFRSLRYCLSGAKCRASCSPALILLPGFEPLGGSGVEKSYETSAR